MGESVDSDRNGDVEKGTELEDVASCEDEEAGVGAFESAFSPASDFGDEGADDEEGAGVGMTRPRRLTRFSKRGPSQHPGSSVEAVPQHHLTVKEPLYQGQGHR